MADLRKQAKLAERWLAEHPDKFYDVVSCGENENGGVPGVVSCLSRETAAPLLTAQHTMFNFRIATAGDIAAYTLRAAAGADALYETETRTREYMHGLQRAPVVNVTFDVESIRQAMTAEESKTTKRKSKDDQQTSAE